MMEILNIPRSRIIGMRLGEVLTSQHLHMAQELTSLVDQGSAQETQFCSILDQTDNKPKSPGSSKPAWRSPAWAINSHLLVPAGPHQPHSHRTELQKTNAFFTNIIQNSVDGIVVVDTKGVPLIFNEGAERILGYKAEEMIGNPEISAVSIRSKWPPR